MLLTVINHPSPFVRIIFFFALLNSIQPWQIPQDMLIITVIVINYFHGQKSLESVPGAEIPLGQVMHKPTLKGFGGRGNLDPREKNKRENGFNFHSLPKVFNPWNSPFFSHSNIPITSSSKMRESPFSLPTIWGFWCSRNSEFPWMWMPKVSHLQSTQKTQVCA